MEATKSYEKIVPRRALSSIVSLGHGYGVTDIGRIQTSLYTPHALRISAAPCGGLQWQGTPAAVCYSYTKRRLSLQRFAEGRNLFLWRFRHGQRIPQSPAAQHHHTGNQLSTRANSHLCGFCSGPQEW